MGNLKVNMDNTDYSSQDFDDMAQSRNTDIKDLYTIDEFNTDGSAGSEYSYTPDWDKWHGMYRTIPELRAIINKLGSWTFGRGIKADKKNKEKLKKIKGFGKDSPRGVLKNQWRTAMICGDSFAEIMQDDYSRTVNLKPLNPGTISIIYNAKGIIIRYEQYIGSNKINEWKPEEIYHLSYERIADEGHGIPFAECLEFFLKAKHEALEDLRILYHRNIKPIKWIEVDTENETEIANVQAKVNTAYQKTENIIIPKGVISGIKDQSTAHYSTLDSLPYIKLISRSIVTACGVPEVVMGWGEDTTEASSKIIYLAFQQEIEDMQQYNEEMIDIQLNIIIELEFPASIETELIKDQKKDKGQIKELNLDPKKDG
jgi:hypothetical protein